MTQAELQRMLDTQTTVYLPAGLIDISLLKIPNGRTMIGAGSGAGGTTLRVIAPTHGLITSGGLQNPSRGVHLAGFKLDGLADQKVVHAAGQSPNSIDQMCGINLVGLTDSLIEGVCVVDTVRTAIYLVGPRNTVRRCLVQRAGRAAPDWPSNWLGIIGRQGIQIDSYGAGDASNMRSIIEDNVLETVIEHGIKVYPGSVGSRVARNIVRDARDFGIYIQDNDNVLVDSNELHGSYGTAIYIGGNRGNANVVTNNKVVGVVEKDMTKSGFTFVNQTDVTWQNNVVSGANLAGIVNSTFASNVNNRVV
jgi:parallel beta-helix repeat protein